MNAKRRVVVIGAGLGGLTTALRLAHAGHQVTVVEKNDRPGGKVGLLERDGFRFDTGPTILTIPGEIRRLFTDLGRETEAYLTLRRFEPIYRAHFRDGTRFDLHTDEAATLEEIRRISPRDVDRYRAFMRRTARIWEQVDGVLFERLYQSWRDLLDPAVLRAGMQVDALRSMYRSVDRAFHDPRIKQLFMFQAIYVGASPRRTPATFTVIPFLEQRQGVWFPDGGLYAIVEAMVRLADELGVEIRCGSEVAAIRVQQGRATGVELTGGTWLPADLVVANSDLVHTYRDLVPADARRHYSDRRLDGYDPSSSAFIVYAAAGTQYPELVHHNIYFGADYDREMQAIFEEKRLPADPSWYICAPTRTDPALAPPGCDALYALQLAPYLTPDGPKWDRAATTLREGEMLARMEERAGLTGLRDTLRWSESFTPRDFAERFNGHHGSIFGLSAITRQSAFMRPPNRSQDVEGLYLVGGSTQPGGGVPMVMLGGRLLADLVASDLRAGRIPA